MADIIFFQNVRLSFPSLTEPNTSVPNAKPKYAASFLMETGEPKLQEFMGRINELGTAKWKEHTQQVMGVINNDRRLRCFSKGEENVNQKTFQVYDGYEGKFVISANNERMPQMIKPDGTPIDPNNTMEAQQVARSMYAGCMVNVALQPWLQDNQHGRAVRCSLVAIQFNADGEAFGEGTPDLSGVFGAAQQAPSTAPIGDVNGGSQDTGVPAFLS